MTQIENGDEPQDDYEEVPGGPGAPIPISQLTVRQYMSSVTRLHMLIRSGCRWSD